MEYCDDHLRRSTYASQWDAQAAKQLEERKALEAQDKDEPLEQRKAVALRIMAELTRKWTRKAVNEPAGFRRFTVDDLRKIYARNTEQQEKQEAAE